MSSKGLRHRKHRFQFPQAEPEWRERVDRWYQLDAAAFGLADAIFQFHKETEPRLSAPGLMLFASPGASNETDWRFVRTGASSPAKFVHTLPSIRATSVCQVLGWSGPTLCLQSDPRTVTAALEEARGFAGPEYPVVWVLTVRSLSLEMEPSVEKISDYEAHLFEVFELRGGAALFGMSPSGPVAEDFPYLLSAGAKIPGEEDPEVTDELIFHWLQDPDRKEGAALRLSSHCSLARTVSFGDT